MQRNPVVVEIQPAEGYVESDAGVRELAETVRRTVCAFPWACRLRQFSSGESNKKLIALALALGQPNTGSELLEDGMVFRVETRNKELHDEAGYPIHSTTCERFPCHTDGTAAPVPYEVVLLHCVRADPSGGETVLVRVDEVIERLAPTTCAALCDPVYPFGENVSSILRGKAGDYLVRYNRQELEQGFKLHETRLDPWHERALKAWQVALAELDASSHALRLHAGECLVIHNARVLHGRFPFDPASGRLLKRVRLWPKPSITWRGRT